MSHVQFDPPKAWPSILHRQSGFYDQTIVADIDSVKNGKDRQSFENTGLQKKSLRRAAAVVLDSTREISSVRVELSKTDRALAVAHAAAEEFEWHSRDSGFAGLIQLIVEQQVSVAAAEAIWGRFKKGVRRVTSRNVKRFDVDALRTFGLSRQKADYVLAIAEAEATGAIDFEGLVKSNDEDAVDKLTSLKGVGRWTAEVYLMFCEGRTDLFPAGDLALQEGYRWASRAENRPTTKELYARAENWRPYRGIAALLLWSYYRGVKSGEIAMPMPKTQKGSQRQPKGRVKQSGRRKKTPR